MVELISKLPQVGTTIFTVMTQRARELNAINLAQGFPDYDPPDTLKALLAKQAISSNHQYAPMAGAALLREQISQKYFASYGYRYDAEDEITVTLGATEGIFSAIQALVHPGDEVILFDPSYDSYAPSVVLAGGRPIHIPLRAPQFAVDWDRVKDTISARTRLIITNTPHNPTGAVWNAQDLETLAELIRHTNVLVLADEVYEHMVFDGRMHASVCGHAELRERSVAVFSFGKTMHATGWRVGYTLAPMAITREIRRVHQFNTFCIAHPLQVALADFLAIQPEHSARLREFYQRKRDYFLHALRGSRFRWVASAGTYFQLLDFGAISSASDVEFADELLRKAGVASIPVSPFYREPVKLSVLRFCFAKNESTLDEAAERLQRM